MPPFRPILCLGIAVLCFVSACASTPKKPVDPNTPGTIRILGDVDGADVYYVAATRDGRPISSGPQYLGSIQQLRRGMQLPPGDYILYLRYGGRALTTWFVRLRPGAFENRRIPEQRRKSQYWDPDQGPAGLGF